MKLAIALALAGSGLAAYSYEGTETTDSAAESVESTESNVVGESTLTVVPLALDMDLSMLMYRLHLTPEPLAAVGLDAFAVQALVEKAATGVSMYGDKLAAADVSYIESRQSVDSLRRDVRAGTASDEEVTKLAAAKEALASAEIERQVALDSIFAEATAELSTDQRMMLGCVRANAGWSLETAYLCAERTELEWVQLRDALANESICEADGTEPDGKCQDLLSQVKSEAGVASAMVGIETHAPSIQASWDAALQD